MYEHGVAAIRTGCGDRVDMHTGGVTLFRAGPGTVVVVPWVVLDRMRAECIRRKAEGHASY